MQRFGEKLRVLRTRRGLSLRSLAQELGYTNAHAYISDFETGKRKPTIDFAFKVAQYFSVAIDQLLRDDLEIDGSEANP